MSVPTPGEEYSKLIEFLRKAQESAAMLSHLRRDESRTLARGWLTVSEGLKEMQKHVTKLAMRGMQ